MKSGTSFELPDFLMNKMCLLRFVLKERIGLSSLEVHLTHDYFSAIPNLSMIADHFRNIILSEEMVEQ